MASKGGLLMGSPVGGMTGRMRHCTRCSCEERWAKLCVESSLDNGKNACV